MLMNSPVQILDSPVRTVPHGDFESHISEQVLKSVLLRLVPTWNVTRIPHVLHALRLWGPDATFVGDAAISPFHTKVFTGLELQSLLLDDWCYQRFVDEKTPILMETKQGVVARH